MARLLNGLSKTDADQRRQEEVGDIKNKDIFAKGKDAAESEARSNRTDKKLLALKTIGKATKGKQSELLNRKGFGLVVSKVKDKTQILKDIATTSKPTASDFGSSQSRESNSKSVQDASSAPPEPSSVPAASAESSSPSLTSSSCEQSSVNGSTANKSSSSANNSLSMLFSQYDASSDSE